VKRQVSAILLTVLVAACGARPGDSATHATADASAPVSTTVPGATNPGDLATIVPASQTAAASQPDLVGPWMIAQFSASAVKDSSNVPDGFREEIIGLSVTNTLGATVLVDDSWRKATDTAIYAPIDVTVVTDKGNAYGEWGHADAGKAFFDGSPGQVAFPAGSTLPMYARVMVPQKSTIATIHVAISKPHDLTLAATLPGYCEESCSADLVYKSGPGTLTPVLGIPHLALGTKTAAGSLAFTLTKLTRSPKGDDCLAYVLEHGPSEISVDETVWNDGGYTSVVYSGVALIDSLGSIWNLAEANSLGLTVPPEEDVATEVCATSSFDRPADHEPGWFGIVGHDEPMAPHPGPVWGWAFVSNPDDADPVALSGLYDLGVLASR
jgi:hypothetical protein